MEMGASPVPPSPYYCSSNSSTVANCARLKPPGKLELKLKEAVKPRCVLIATSGFERSLIGFIANVVDL